MTKTNAIAPVTKPARDPRTEPELALHETIEWVFGHAPDLRPEPWDRRLADKSFAATLVQHVGERLAQKYSRRPEWIRMKHALERMPRALLDHRLNRHELADLRAAVDRDIHAIENPPPVPEPTPLMLELARDLAIQLPKERDAATVVLQRALHQATSSDRRASIASDTLIASIAFDAVNGHALRARYALVGAGLPTVRSDDRVFGGAAPDVLCPPAPSLEPMPDSACQMAPRSLITIGVHLGHGPLPRFTDDELRARRDKVEKEKAARGADLKRRIDAGEFKGKVHHHESGITYAADSWAKHELEVWENEQNAALQRDLHAMYVEWHGKILGDIDQVLAEQKKTAPGALATWWVRELRRHVAMNSLDRGLRSTAAVENESTELEAWRVARSFGFFPQAAEAAH